MQALGFGSWVKALAFFAAVASGGATCCQSQPERALAAARTAYEEAMDKVRTQARAAAKNSKLPIKERQDRLERLKQMGAWPDEATREAQMPQVAAARTAMDAAYAACLEAVLEADEELAKSIRAEWDQWNRTEDLTSWVEIEKKQLVAPFAGTRWLLPIELPQFFRLELRGTAKLDTPVRLALPGEQAPRLVELLVDRGCFHVVVTLGPDGVIAVDLGGRRPIALGVADSPDRPPFLDAEGAQIDQLRWKPAPVHVATEGEATGKDPIEVDKHAIAMVLVVDRSGSMGEVVTAGRTKMSYAKTCALQTARQLMEGDQVGIVTFGNKGQGRIELPLTDATNLPAVQAGIDKLAHAREMTYLLPGLQLADQMLQGSKAAVKHVVVVTDGEFFTVEAMALRSLANKMRTERQQTVSMLSIVGKGSTGEFQRYAEEITQDGGGVFIAEPDPARVPVFVSAEVTRALSRVGRQPRRDGEVDPTQPAPPTSPKKAPKEPDPSQKPPTPPSAESPVEAPVRLSVRAVAPSPLLLP